jgi:hypothetical protein
MPATFIHLSDIHFGQVKGGQRLVHSDVKERLIEDAASLVATMETARAAGIIVTGDIAYAGKRDEYISAAEWLDRLAAAVGCAKTSVQVVPGNHDIDRDAISSGCKLMLDQIITGGEPKLDAFLENELDREVLYGRFCGYRPFAEGYDCPLDVEGGVASERRLELAPGRTLRFIGLNSALICSAKDERGRLLLGARQRVLPRHSGEELMVLAHHPLQWLQDSDDAQRYVRSRARLFVSGHEHKPSLHVERLREGCDLMLLAAGAAVPPVTDDRFTYTYNLLTFGLDVPSDGLQVTIKPRVWSMDDTKFTEDVIRLGGRDPTFVLGCPNFRGAPKPVLPATLSREARTLGAPTEAAPKVSVADAHQRGKGMPDPFPLLLLRFFRDLTPAQRLEVLIKLKALPDDWRDSLTHSMERRAVDSIAASGRLSDLEAAIGEINTNKQMTREHS